MKLNKILAAAAAGMLVLSLAGCQNSNLSVNINKDLNAEITGENAGTDLVGGAAVLTVEKDQKLTAEAEVTAGEIKVSLYDMSGSDDAEGVPEVDRNAPAALEFTVAASGITEYKVPEGDYFVDVAVLDKFTGHVIIKAE